MSNAADSALVQALRNRSKAPAPAGLKDSDLLNLILMNVKKMADHLVGGQDVPKGDIVTTQESHTP